MGLFGYSTFGYGYDRFYRNYRDYDFPVPTQEEDPKVEVLEKQQRAANSNKRHKQRTIHVQAEKDVPAFLKNLVNKAVKKEEDPPRRRWPF